MKKKLFSGLIMVVTVTLLTIAMSATVFAGGIKTPITSITIPEKIWPEKVDLEKDIEPTKQITNYSGVPENSLMNNGIVCGWISALSEEESGKIEDELKASFAGREWTSLIDLKGAGIITSTNRLVVGRRYGYVCTFEAKTEFGFPEDMTQLTLTVGGVTIPSDRKIRISADYMCIYLDLGVLQADGTFSGGDFNKTEDVKTGDTNSIVIIMLIMFASLAIIKLSGKKRKSN